MFKRAKGFSKKKFVHVPSDRGDERTEEEMTRISATVKPKKYVSANEKYDIDSIASEVRYKKEYDELLVRLNIILKDTDRYKEFLKEFNYTGYDTYRELVEYTDAIHDAMDHENYNDMKNLAEQWDPDSEILRKMRGEWPESTRQFGELPFQPETAVFEGFVDPEEVVVDKLMRQQYFQKHAAEEREEVYEPARTVQEYLLERAANRATRPQQTRRRIEYSPARTMQEYLLGRGETRK